MYWHSKKQMSCETSTFGSEFVAMKQATEYVRGLRYKLRMFGIPCEEPTFIYGDNQSVLANTTNPSSQLKKKSNAITYHFVREGIARDEWRTTYIDTDDITHLTYLPSLCLLGRSKRSMSVGCCGGFIRRHSCRFQGRCSMTSESKHLCCNSNDGLRAFPIEERKKDSYL